MIVTDDFMDLIIIDDVIISIWVFLTKGELGELWNILSLTTQKISNWFFLLIFELWPILKVLALATTVFHLVIVTMITSCQPLPKSNQLADIQRGAVPSVAKSLDLCWLLISIAYLSRQMCWKPTCHFVSSFMDDHIDTLIGNCVKFSRRQRLRDVTSCNISDPVWSLSVQSTSEKLFSLNPGQWNMLFFLVYMKSKRDCDGLFSL